MDNFKEQLVTVENKTAYKIKKVKAYVTQKKVFVNKTTNK